MSKSYRIRSTPGEGNGYLKVNLDLNQNYDFLEILSLKISQKDEYQNFCADYGVVAGRVIINGGFGVPNVKVSIFVPVEDRDLDDPVKSAIYNYTEPFPDQKNQNGIRYNLLPKNQQSLDHTPVGTFPKKREILDDKTTLEIYEKYYKYTTTTNEAGDYILFGIPVGQHYLHYDMDVSDIGFISSRPFELINKGYSDDLFANKFKFNSSNNLDSLPQIFSENIPVTVEPYWCDSLSVGSALGINRLDIEPNVEIIPTSVFMGSIFSDDEKDSLNKNCKPSREMGKMNEVITGAGKIEALRRTVSGSIEKFNFKEDSIDENGNWSVLVPMNLRKVVTDEFGNFVPSPDGIKGVATEADFRFRISMDATSNDKRLRQRAKFLVPNTNNNFVFDEFSPKDLVNTTLFNKNEQLSTITTGTDYENDLRNQYNYLEEFYTFRWKKVYTVKQYIGRMQKSFTDEARGFIGIKDIINAEGVNKYPTNRFDTNINPLYTIICFLLTLFGNIVGFLNGIINVINGLITAICQVKLPLGLKIELSYCFRIAGCGTCSQAYKDSCCSTHQNNSDTCSNSDNGNDGNAGDGTHCSAGEGTGCGKCKCNSSGDETAEFSLQIQLKWGCLFGRLFCKKCKSSCPEGQPHSCCPIKNNGEGDDPNESVCDNESLSYAYGCACKNERFNNGVLDGVPDAPSCCSDCCVKIPLIPLRCAEEGKEWRVTHIPSPFAPFQCNKTYVAPYGCKNCAGLQTAGVKDWVSCVLEPVAVFLRMLKFDFYNDWVGGSLYFPLIKRKYKLKKSKRKFGQIKKDKFCDYECRIREGGNLTNNFQGNPTYSQWRIKIPTIIFSNPSITVGGCTAKIKGKRVTDWYGTPENDDETDNKNLAVQEITFNGKTSSQDGCVISFNNFAEFENTFNAQSIPFVIKNREITTFHGKPEYVETEDPNGFSTWENIGGHGHHRNICDPTRMVERREFFKTSSDCSGPVPENDVPQDNLLGGEDGSFDNPESEEDNGSLGLDGLFNPDNKCEGLNCTPDCGQNGVAPCKNKPQAYDDYKVIIEHGLISWYDGEIYYTPYIKPGDFKENNNEYKANLMLPTTIMELGSMNYCDIDDVPFIMDQLEPTTFQVSYEEFKVKIDGDPDPYNGGDKKVINKLDDKKDSSLNLRAYVEFGCAAVVCANIQAAVNQSQIGVEIVDKDDIGIEAGSCFVRFDHDADIREYFCRRFNGYKSDRSFHHTRPGGIDSDNVYNTYPDITVYNSPDLYYELPDGTIVFSEYNDGDSFISGDACGYKDTNGNPDYFYGLAPGATGQFIDYPNGNNSLNFGTQEILDDVNDDDNFEENVSGIRFNRSQTPYHLYFGLVPGKTALHKTVSKFFADKINAVTLQGLGQSNDSVEENINNQPNVNNVSDNPFTVYKTCLGETLLKKVDVGQVQQNTNNTGGGSQGNNNPSGGSGGSGSGGSGTGSGGGTSTGGSVGTSGTGSSGTGSSGTGSSNTPNFTLIDTFGQNFTSPVSITSAPCTVNGEVTETRNFTIVLNSGTATINVNMYGGGTFNLCPNTIGSNGNAFNVNINDGNGGPINQTIVSEVVGVYQNSSQTYTINNVGTYEVQVEVIPYFNFDGFEIFVGVS